MKNAKRNFSLFTMFFQLSCIEYTRKMLPDLYIFSCMRKLIVRREKFFWSVDFENFMSNIRFTEVQISNNWYEEWGKIACKNIICRKQSYKKRWKIFCFNNCRHLVIKKKSKKKNWNQKMNYLFLDFVSADCTSHKACKYM